MTRTQKPIDIHGWLDENGLDDYLLGGPVPLDGNVSFDTGAAYSLEALLDGAAPSVPVELTPDGAPVILTAWDDSDGIVEVRSDEPIALVGSDDGVVSQLNDRYFVVQTRKLDGPLAFTTGAGGVLLTADADGRIVWRGLTSPQATAHAPAADGTDWVDAGDSWLRERVAPLAGEGGAHAMIAAGLALRLAERGQRTAESVLEALLSGDAPSLRVQAWLRSLSIPELEQAEREGLLLVNDLVTTLESAETADDYWGRAGAAEQREHLAALGAALAEVNRGSVLREALADVDARFGARIEPLSVGTTPPEVSRRVGLTELGAWWSGLRPEDSGTE